MCDSANHSKEQPTTSRLQLFTVILLALILVVVTFAVGHRLGASGYQGQLPEHQPVVVPPKGFVVLVNKEGRAVVIAEKESQPSYTVQDAYTVRGLRTPIGLSRPTPLFPPLSTSLLGN